MQDADGARPDRVAAEPQPPGVGGGLGCGGLNSDAGGSGGPEAPQPQLTRARSSSSDGARTPLWTLKATNFLGTAAFACIGKFLIVYWADIGITRQQMGLLNLLPPVVGFIGQFFWATVIDRVGSYKLTLVMTSVISSLFLFAQLIPAVYTSFPLLCINNSLSGFFGCCGGPIIDAMTLTVLEEQGEEKENYGDQRLWVAVGWGGMSLVSGQLVDSFGIDFIFYAYGVLQSLNLLVCSIFLPGSKRSRRAAAASSSVSLSAFLTFDMCWFLAHAFMYGVACSLVENFLMVFLVQDFDHTPKLLVGGSVAVMCVFEIPVFKYIDRLWKPRTVTPTDGDGSCAEAQEARPPCCSLTGVFLICQVVLAARCLLYVLLPRSQPWLVLFIEPLHGFTFAAMWTATVEYGNRLAPKEARARMMTLLNGVWFLVAGGLGSLFWGLLIPEPPQGFGFKPTFIFNAIFIVAWCAVWQAGLLVRSRTRSTHRVEGGSADLLAHPESG